MLWLISQIFSSYALTTLEITPPIHNLIYYFPLTHLCCFLLGISGAMYFKKQTFPSNKFLSIFIVLLLALLNNYQALINATLNIKIAFASIFYAPLFLLLIMSIASDRSVITNILKKKPLVLLGESSYALYILQAPVFCAYQIYLASKLQLEPLPNFLACFTILTLVSIFFFLLFEKPINKHIRNLSIKSNHR